MASRNVPMLDGDWLLGKEPTHHGHSLWFASVLCLMVCGAVVWTWPTLSRWYLQRHYLEQVQRAESLEDAAPGLIGLQSLLPHSAPRLVVCLNHANPEIAQMVNDTLSQHIQELEAKPSLNRRAAAQWMAAAIQGMALQPNLVDRHPLSLLGARVRDLCREDEHVTSQLAADRLDHVFGWKQDPLMPRIDKVKNYTSSDQPGIVAPVRISLASATYDVPADEPPLSENKPLDASSSHVRSLSDNQPAYETNIDGSSEALAPIVSARIPFSDNVTNGQPMNPNSHPSQPTTYSMTDAVTTPTVDNQGLAESYTRNLEPNPTPQNQQVDRTAIPTIEPPPNNSISIANAAPSLEQRSLRQETSYSTTYSSTPSTQNEDTIPAGMEKFSDEQVISLLGSVQPSKANAATRELERRGWNQQQLSMAVELAQGSTRQRLEAMERLVKNGQFQPIPWLTWMAQVGDRDVRRHAVVLLGSIADENAQRQLRLLKNRERDSEVRDQIHRVLLSAGNGTNSLRR